MARVALIVVAMEELPKRPAWQIGTDRIIKGIDNVFRNGC